MYVEKKWQISGMGGWLFAFCNWPMPGLIHNTTCMWTSDSVFLVFLACVCISLIRWYIAEQSEAAFCFCLRQPQDWCKTICVSTQTICISLLSAVRVGFLFPCCLHQPTRPTVIRKERTPTGVAKQFFLCVSAFCFGVMANIQWECVFCNSASVCVNIQCTCVGSLSFGTFVACASSTEYQLVQKQVDYWKWSWALYNVHLFNLNGLVHNVCKLLK